MEIGAQFYTIRDFCKTKEDFTESLKKVAYIGYTNVQISGVCEYEPEWLRDRLHENGLKCVLTHNVAEKLQSEPAKVAADHNVFDCDYVGLGWYTFDESDESKSFKNYIKTYLPVAKVLRENGKYFMHHNHDQEFQKINGKTVMELLVENFSSETLGFTLDTFCVQAGGGDPAQWLELLSGRVPCIHLKDYSFGRKMAVLGEGNINFDRVFAAAEKAGTKYMLVEQDDCNGENPFDCLKRSYEYLKARGF